MRIKMLTTAACKDFIASMGNVVDLPESQAKELVDGGYAEAVDKPKPEPVKPASKSLSVEPPKAKKPKKKAKK